MKVKFKERDLEKRDKIVNAALKEFSVHDFEKASTNNIVKEAKVSKGLLYHYFESKQELYDYLFDFVFITVLEGLKNKIDWEQQDFFKRLRDVVVIKMNLTKKYPDIYNFAMKLIRDLSFEKMQELSSNYSVDMLEKIYSENIDYSLFKEGIPMDKVIMIVQSTFEKYSESLAARQVFDGDMILKELNEYVELFEKMFYKQGGSL